MPGSLRIQFFNRSQGLNVTRRAVPCFIPAHFRAVLVAWQGGTRSHKRRQASRKSWRKFWSELWTQTHQSSRRRCAVQHKTWLSCCWQYRRYYGQRSFRSAMRLVQCINYWRDFHIKMPFYASPVVETPIPEGFTMQNAIPGSSCG